MRLSVFLIMAVLLMAASCQKSTTMVEPPMSAENQLLGTWRFRETVILLDYGPPGGTTKTPATQQLDFIFTKDGGFTEALDGKQQTGSFSVDTLIKSSGEKVPNLTIKVGQNSQVFYPWLSPKSDTLKLGLPVSSVASAYYVLVRG